MTPPPASTNARRLRGFVGWVVTPMVVGVVLALGPGASCVPAEEATSAPRSADSTHGDAPVFDHGPFDRLLKAHVTEHGYVDYAELDKHSAELDRYISAIATAPVDDMERANKLALLINAYNAFTLRLILDYWDNGELASINDIPKGRRWDHVRWNIAGKTWSLNQIEHKRIRPIFEEPRIHFALVCAAVGCPKLRNEAYQPDRIEEQLEDQTVYAHRQPRWLRYDAARNVVYLTKLYEWYGVDFEEDAGSVLAFVARYVPDVKRAVARGKAPRIAWLEYDWDLNSVRNKP